MTALSSNLKRLMDQQKITVSELARRTDIAQPIVHRLSTGKNVNPKIATISPIARYFTVTISHLLGELPLSVDDRGNQPQECRSWKRVPILSWQEAVAHRLDFFYEQSVSSSHIATDADVGTCSYALSVESCSLEPLFPLGTVLVVDPERTAQDGDFVIVRLGDSQIACLRRIVFDGSEHYYKSLNPAFDQEKVVKKLAGDQVLAVVVQAKRNY